MEQLFLAVGGQVAPHKIHISVSLYSQHLRNWLQYFPLEQFLIIEARELVKDPLSVTTKVETFLNLRHKITAENFVLDKQKGFYCYRQNSNSAKTCMGKKKGVEHPPINSTTERKLRDFFRPYNKDFYRIIGKDFGWPE